MEKTRMKIKYILKRAISTHHTCFIDRFSKKFDHKVKLYGSLFSFFCPNFKNVVSVKMQWALLKPNQEATLEASED